MSAVAAAMSASMYRGLYSDTFTFANGTVFADYTDGEWHLSPEGLGDREPQINTNAIRGHNPSGGTTNQPTLYLAPNMHGSNCWIEGTHYSLFQTNRSLNLVIGAVDADNWAGIKVSGTGSSGVRLITNNAGTITDSAVVQGQGGLDYVYRIEKIGTDFEFFIDNGGGFSSEGTETYSHANGVWMGVYQWGTESSGGPTSQLWTQFRCGRLPD